MLIDGKYFATTFYLFQAFETGYKPGIGDNSSWEMTRVVDLEPKLRRYCNEEETLLGFEIIQLFKKDVLSSTHSFQTGM